MIIYYSSSIKGKIYDLIIVTILIKSRKSTVNWKKWRVEYKTKGLNIILKILINSQAFSYWHVVCWGSMIIVDVKFIIYEY